MRIVSSLLGRLACLLDPGVVVCWAPTSPPRDCWSHDTLVLRDALLLKLILRLTSHRRKVLEKLLSIEEVVLTQLLGYSPISVARAMLWACLLRPGNALSSLSGTLTIEGRYRHAIVSWGLMQRFVNLFSGILRGWDQIASASRSVDTHVGRVVVLLVSVLGEGGLVYDLHSFFG